MHPDLSSLDSTKATACWCATTQTPVRPQRRGSRTGTSSGWMTRSSPSTSGARHPTSARGVCLLPRPWIRTTAACRSIWVRRFTASSMPAFPSAQKMHAIALVCSKNYNYFMPKKSVKCLTNTGEYIAVLSSTLVFRPGVYGLIIVDEKIVLLRNKSNNKYWLPGGGVAVGETMVEALKKEIREETGLNLIQSTFATTTERFFFYKPTNEAFHAVLNFFYCEVQFNKLIADNKVDDDESGKPRWISIHKLKPSDFADHGELIISLIKRF